MPKWTPASGDDETTIAKCGTETCLESDFFNTVDSVNGDSYR